MGVEEVTELIVHDVGGAADKPEIMAVIIGEVGVSKDFTPEERKSLRASARASRARACRSRSICRVGSAWRTRFWTWWKKKGPISGTPSFVT